MEQSSVTWTRLFFSGFWIRPEVTGWWILKKSLSQYLRSLAIIFNSRVVTIAEKKMLLIWSLARLSTSTLQTHRRLNNYWQKAIASIKRALIGSYSLDKRMDRPSTCKFILKSVALGRTVAKIKHKFNKLLTIWSSRWWWISNRLTLWTTRVTHRLN